MPLLVTDDAVHTIIENKIEIYENIHDNEWKMILALCGSFILLALCLMCGVIFFLKCVTPKEPVTVDIGVSDEFMDNDSSCSDPRNTSSHRLIPDISMISSTLPTFTAPPSSLPESTPSYWSATQLLTEHEHRALSASYGSRSLTPIKEEYLEYFDEFPLHDDYYEISNRGLTNLGYKSNNGTPVHTLKDTNVEGTPPAEDTASIVSVVSNYHHNMEKYDDDEQDTPATPVRFSTAVQTIAPSAIATNRLSSDYVASLRNRNTSLV